jgi:hypothetical protein
VTKEKKSILGMGHHKKPYFCAAEILTNGRLLYGILTTCRGFVKTSDLNSGGKVYEVLS